LKKTCFGRAGLASLLVCAAVSASAQTPAGQPPAAPADPNGDLRPATTTFLGDTGLWFVPTGEVLPERQWSVTLYRRGTNFVQGFTNVGDFAGTFAYGLGGRAELFGSFLFDTRIDRDLRPIFSFADEEVGGVVDRYPRVRGGWTGNKIGDLYLGAKFNLWSEDRAYPAAVAVRAGLKAPTGDEAAGVSTGKADVFFDFIASKEAAERVDVAGYAGYEFRGRPDGFDTPRGAMRWGAGAGFPSRGPLRGVVELNGLVLTGDGTQITGLPFVANDGSQSPFLSATENTTRATAGLTWQHRNGFFLGGGVAWNVPMESRDGYTTDGDAPGDFVDVQFRVGFHPGVRSFMLPPPPSPPPPPPAVVNRAPSVQARCEPCVVEVGRTSAVTAVAQDPDGDSLTYRWSAPAGTMQNPGDRQTVWTAPLQEGPVQLTVRVDDGKGESASAPVTIQVMRPAAVVELIFEDVYFDFDRSSLRPEALRLLDDAVAKLMANPGRNLIIEGHTCNIGTAEYNLALGDRRASSVREYFVSRGIAAARLEVRSYGEERPKYDNAREETRRLNRRAALTVNLQR
jgi:outer membrane protein OmpA-like peptidoglycan-associated protein